MKNMFLFLNMILLAPFALQSATFYVTNTGDSAVINSGSFRRALIDLNLSADADNTINFNIIGTGPFTLAPASIYPAITKKVFINGYFQPGSKPATATELATLLVEIDGTGAGAVADGIVLAPGSGGSRISGLAINRFEGNTIFVNTSNNTITGNYLGTNINGTLGLTNGTRGINIDVTTENNVIGGLQPANRNIISGFNADALNAGIAIRNSGGNTQIIGNYIGVDVTGTQAISNRTGVQLFPDALDTRISCNVIAHSLVGVDPSSGIGVEVQTNSIGNRILANSIFDNGRLGIDVQMNANGNQPAPVLTAASALGKTIIVSGTLAGSVASNAYRIEFFVNQTDGGTNTEGKNFVGRALVTTDPLGNATFNHVRLPSKATVGQFVSATATNLVNNNSSEFSLNRVLEQGSFESDLSIAVYLKYCNNDDEPCAVPVV